MLDESIQSKVCTKCGESKPLDQYSSLKGKPNAYPSCKSCVRKYMREYHAANREQNRERARQHYKANKEARNAASAAWHEANRESSLERNRAYYQANKDRFREWGRRWRAENAERFREVNAEDQRRRRARLREAEIGTVDLDALWTGYCGLCHLPLDRSLVYPDPLSKSVDHIIPLVRGGAHEQTNLQWTHLRCNVLKGAREQKAGCSD